MLLDEVRGYLEREAPAGAFVGLMAAQGKAGFYSRRGFSPRPQDGPGMSLSRSPGAASLPRDADSRPAGGAAG